MDEGEEDKQVIGQSFCKYDKKRLEMVEIIRTADTDSDLEEFRETIKNVLIGGDETITPARLRRQLKKYQVKVRYLFRRIGKGLRVVPLIQH